MRQRYNRTRINFLFCEKVAVKIASYIDAITDIKLLETDIIQRIITKIRGFYAYFVKAGVQLELAAGDCGYCAGESKPCALGRCVAGS